MEGREEDSMKKNNPSIMTNRDLMTEYEGSDNPSRYALVEEMAKRLRWKMITKDVVPVFKQYKLNGSGDKFD